MKSCFMKLIILITVESSVGTTLRCPLSPLKLNGQQNSIHTSPVNSPKKHNLQERISSPLKLNLQQRIAVTSPVKSPRKPEHERLLLSSPVKSPCKLNLSSPMKSPRKLDFLQRTALPSPVKFSNKSKSGSPMKSPLKSPNLKLGKPDCKYALEDDIFKVLNKCRVTLVCKKDCEHELIFQNDRTCFC